MRLSAAVNHSLEKFLQINSIQFIIELRRRAAPCLFLCADDLPKQKN